MASRRVQLILLCEDQKQEYFLWHFLDELGWNLPKRNARVMKPAPGSEAASRWVEKRFPLELREYRRQKAQHACILVTVIDADCVPLISRKRHMKEECENVNVQFRQEGEAVAIFVPKRNIETWIAFLLNPKSVISEETDPKRFKKGVPSDSLPAVKVLVEAYNTNELSEMLPSLQDACEEYRVYLAPFRQEMMK